MFIDARLIDLADRLAAWLQRRGACLATIKMLISISFVATLFIQASTPIMTFICGIILGFRFREWNRDHNYGEDARRVLAMNARVLFVRERGLYVRMFGWFFVFTGLAIDLLTHVPLPLALLGASSLFSLFYADCCFFLGPGEHGRQRWSLRVGRAAMQESP